MRQSGLVTKTTKDISQEEVSKNAQLLMRAGYIDKLSAGVYTYLPLGLRMVKKIEQIVREEMDAVGGQELLMPALTPKENWTATGRWDSFDALFKLNGHDGKEYALGATHEEIVAPLMKKFIFSYKDLPAAVYQIQTKFRNEPRAKSGILRGREFIMKDLYSFHTSQEHLDEYYDQVKEAYFKVFERVGLLSKTHLTFASGGAFSKYSHEFQTLSENGEDTIYICPSCDLAYNEEIIEELTECEDCGTQKAEFRKEPAVEVGNIFKLGTKFTDPVGLTYTDEDNSEKPVIMACYGLGITRILGTIVEVLSDENGMNLPLSIAPFHIHLVQLGEDEDVVKTSESIYADLTEAGYDVLYDDRAESPGSKLKDSDLMGIPVRVVISSKTVAAGKIEVKRRSESEAELIKPKKLIDYLNA